MKATVQRALPLRYHQCRKAAPGLLVAGTVAMAASFLSNSYGAHLSAGKLPVPAFLIAFPVLVAMNSVDLLVEPVRSVLVDASRWCLVIAIAALGMKTNLKALAKVGHRAITLIVAETIFLALFVLGVIYFSA
jgi:uncharacterized membrane protein YadS